MLFNYKCNLEFPFDLMSHVKQFEELKIQLEAIKSATNNFADESCIGRGGFGKVYRGKIACSYGHAMVALKRLDRRYGQGNTEFWKEIMMLSCYKHKNIVSLVGFCDDFGEKILVYEYLPNKSLDLNLNNDKLTWIGRLKICIGAARGLAYLHNEIGTQQRVLHRDIKSSNILLDKDMNAKISDFGLSKFGPANQEFTFLFSNAVGTHGYCDPLYQEKGLLTKESDVYSFGVVLFEVLCGRLCIDYINSVNQSLATLARKSYEENKIDEIVYNKIKNEINPESLRVFATIAYRCLKRNREERPSMTDIVRELETALGYQDPDVAIKEYAYETGGSLVVTIHNGNYRESRKTFVYLRLGYDVRRTTSIKSNENPIWNETFKFTLEKPANAILQLGFAFESLWTQELLGDVDINVAEVVKEKHINNMYEFENVKIQVELKWEPSALPTDGAPSPPATNFRRKPNPITCLKARRWNADKTG
ncbi:hypothetical protein R6Q59_002850 [Mikania micrantha]